MIEATCSACGTLNRIAEADVPVGAKFVNCASCKSRVAVSSSTTIGGAATPPKLPAIPASALPAKSPAVPPKLPVKTGPNEIIDLADLPAPKRGSALGQEQSRPAPKSGLSAAEDSDLPAPKGPSSRTAPIRLPESGALDLDDLLAPVGTPLPARGVKSGAGVIDLGAVDSGIDLPAPKVTNRTLSEFAPPRAPAKAPASGPPADLEIPDLLAFKGESTGRDAQDLKPKNREITDLPAPKGPSNITDLPAPKGPSNITGLPAPKGPSNITDLPMPKGPSNITDLPMPKGPSNITDLPTPKVPNADLAPKGFFDNLPKSAGAAAQTKTGVGTDVAPKGFFDNLPAAKSPSATAKSSDVAPKGFFDDLPQPAGAAAQTKQGVGTGVAPKGFFDELSSPTARPVNKPEPIPSGFFDDLGDVNKPEAPTAFIDDAPARIAKPARAASEGLPKTTPPPTASDVPELDLELGTPTGAARAAGAAEPNDKRQQFDDLDLSSPTAPPIHRQLEQNQGTRASGPGSTEHSVLSRPGGGAELSLELEEPRASTPKLQTKRTDSGAVETVATPKKQRTKLFAGIAVGLLAVGGGGFVMYQRKAAAQERQDEISALLKTARSSLVASDAQHWQRTTAAARKVLALDDKNGAALGIAAEATIAGALEEGVNLTARLTAGRTLIKDGLSANVTSPEMQRATALQAITTPPPTTEKLEMLHAQSPQDVNLTLYLGWGQAAKGDHAAAITTFDSLVPTPLKLTALYARGRSKLALADLEGATADFTAVLAEAREHIGAMIGLAAALPPSKIAQQEADLSAIIHLKIFPDADPRVRVLASVLLGDDAVRAGRLDVARGHYRAALAISDAEVSAMSGLAEVELRDNKLDVAKELVDKAVRTSPNDVRAQLAASELSVKVGNTTDAGQRLSLLASRTPPLAPLEQARLLTITGELHEKKEEKDAAIDAYIAGAKIAGDLDLAPTMAAVRLLTGLAATALEAKDAARAAELHARADALLSGLAEKAKADPTLALALGMAYLQSGDGAKAEPLLRQAMEARPNDADPMFQLAKAFARQNKLEDAISQLKKAREIDGTRVEFGFELARTYEAAKRDTDANLLYTELLVIKELPVELRGHACRFFARTNQIEKAAAQGDEIFKVEPTNASGLYCKGEGALLTKKGEVARKLFQQAVQSDPSAQYLDAQGRAAELVLEQSGDTKYQDEVIRVYQLAHTSAPTMVNPLVGQGRMFVIRKEYTKAMEVLVQADALQSGDPEITYLMGISLQAKGDKTGAIKWLKRSNLAKPKADTSHRLSLLYDDTNQTPEAIAAYRQAIDLAFEAEKADGKQIEWLTESLYRYGDLQQDPSAKRSAWKQYVERHPPDSQRLISVKQQLATTLLTP